MPNRSNNRRSNKERTKKINRAPSKNVKNAM